MKFTFSYFLTFMLLSTAWIAPAQTILKSKADSLFNKNGEIYFRFQMNEKTRVDSISGIISIDNYKDGEVFAYANRNEFTRFLKLNIDYVLLPNPGSLLTDEELNMGNWQKDNKNMTIWNFYPTYDQYLTLMSGFASSYPAICRLDTIGTTIQGRLLLSVKISDSVNYDRGVPEVFLTSSMHGDETTAYIMMLHLIDTLLNAYGNSTRLTNLVKNTQIFINPLANPDGTFKGGNNTVGGAIRGNKNNLDLNRNYPGADLDQHPDDDMWQPETMAFMNYADRLHLNLAMNFHGGAEVVNYPWDTWLPPRVTADDSWWQFVSNEYADTCQRYGAAGYFTYPYLSGITNGAVWYVVNGGRQDYHNYFKHIREVCLEISMTKNPPASELLSFWKYNYRSFFNYIEQSGYGINGKVYDSITNAPIAAKVFISGFDIDSSFVYSSLPSGWYFRMIDAGTRNLTFSAPGYYPRTVIGVTSARRAVNRLHVKLRPIDNYWPSGFFANAITPHQINLSWSRNGSNDPVMIAFNTSNSFGTPVSGTAYTAGMNIPGGGLIIYNGSDGTFQHSMLNPGTTYYYRAWSVRSGNTYSAPAAASATTECGTYYTFPIIENFSTSVSSIQLPPCWSQEATGGTNPLYKWIRSNTNNAGGTNWEMRLTSQNINSGTTRLKTFFFNTTGVSLLTLSFKHRLIGTATGATIKIQSSSNGVNWTDEGWSVASSSSTIGPATVTINIVNNLNSPATMIAFVVTGNLNRVSNWYIDDVSLKAPGYWVGGTIASPTDWSTATNWGDGTVPVAATNVYIPPRSYLPVVNSDPATPAECNNLVITKNSMITVGSGKAIRVNGKMTLQGP